MFEQAWFSLALTKCNCFGAGTELAKLYNVSREFLYQNVRLIEDAFNACRLSVMAVGQEIKGIEKRQPEKEICMTCQRAIGANSPRRGRQIQ